MLAQTNGIVLQAVKYSENSLIVKMYTEQKGISSFMVKSVKSKRSRFKPVYFQPLSILDFVAFYRENRDIAPLREISSCLQYKTIPYDTLKIAQAMFIAEVLLKTLRESEANYNLFCFITGSLDFLDKCESRTADFHLVFLINLAIYLGFAPQNNYSETCRYFNMNEGRFDDSKTNTEYYLDEQMSKLFSLVINCKYENLEKLSLSYIQRKEILNKILEFYRIHVNGFGVLKSNMILEEVLA